MTSSEASLPTRLRLNQVTAINWSSTFSTQRTFRFVWLKLFYTVLTYLSLMYLLTY